VFVKIIEEFCTLMCKRTRTALQLDPTNAAVPDEVLKRRALTLVFLSPGKTFSSFKSRTIAPPTSTRRLRQAGHRAC
jgi:hypothetical protein